MLLQDEKMKLLHFQRLNAQVAQEKSSIKDSEEDIEKDTKIQEDAHNLVPNFFIY